MDILTAGAKPRTSKTESDVWGEESQRLSIAFRRTMSGAKLSGEQSEAHHPILRPEGTLQNININSGAIFEKKRLRGRGLYMRFQ